MLSNTVTQARPHGEQLQEGDGSCLTDCWIVGPECWFSFYKVYDT